MNQSEEIGELAKALAQAQGEILPALKDSANPFFKSRYADLSSVWSACRPALTKYGLSVVQLGEEGVDSIMLVTMLMHSSGQWIKSRMPISLILPEKTDKYGKLQASRRMDAQEIGSALTYFRRYSLAAIAGVCPEDDDGNAATRPQSAPNVQKITRESADELHTMFEKCPLNFRKYILNKISQEMKIGSFYELPTTCYDALRLSIEQNMTKEVEVKNDV